MKAFLVQTLLAVWFPLSAVAADPVTVNASSAIIVACVDGSCRGDAPSNLQRTFCPVFRMALGGGFTGQRPRWNL
ncbi:MAG: hypothetical protein J6386_17605 [Candidatus Synoicihabitans palmerolidicus]|nr:hypothetical protein [Candidatus Synoicihabitans palmerolidicus]